MLAVPQPPGTDPSTAIEHLDGKPVVRVTEDGNTMDAFLRCCYPVPNPALDISQLAAVYGAGDKYDVEAVKKHAVSELSHYVSQTDDSLRAYVLACHFGLRAEARRAARQTLEMRKEDIMRPRFPELDLIQASSYTRLLNYRQECLSELAELFTVDYHIREVSDGDGRPPLWERYNESGPDCHCPISRGFMYEGDPASDDDDDDIVNDYDEDRNHTKYWIKRWCARYMNQMADSLQHDKLDVPIRDALKDRNALARALAGASQCGSCGQKCTKEFLRLLEEIDKDAEKILAYNHHDVEFVCG
ncbi:hypothetical protein NM688_g9392 [Phlebia brevispora]|uniref:Uncharacterized protein n=1 Tax=Phlebia brevispora TaxID=194682 RepID=A0ACC1RJR4_9APHY|nr:hypothetical protein NM688_g9392 [Phlebia brevispora]